MLSNDSRVISNVIKNLFEKWELSSEQQRVLLGFDSVEELDNFFGLDYDIENESELMLRLSILVDIHASLRTIFQNEKNVYGFMKMKNHNEPFFGDTPLGYSCKSFQNLKQTQQYLNAFGL
jgi:hypothetical protein